MSGQPCLCGEDHDLAAHEFPPGTDEPLALTHLRKFNEGMTICNICREPLPDRLIRDHFEAARVEAARGGGA